MLELYLPAQRSFNEETEEFVIFPQTTLRLEHSLISVSKWESKWHKSFLSADSYTLEEFTDYIRCMSLSSVDMLTIKRLSSKDIQVILDYIHDPMTATTFSKTSKKTSRQIVTSELVYFWMISFEIPFECEKWHLNRLLTLIEVCNRKQNPVKMSKREARDFRNAANEARRKKLGSNG